MSTPCKLTALRAILGAHAPLVVAYSGGVDSAYLLSEARRTLGRDAVLGVIADSPSLPRLALADALVLAQEMDAQVETVLTSELDDARYAANPLNRCYFCKAELFQHLDGLARTRGFRAIAYGENADDAHSVRPGARAAEEFAVLAPLREAGLSKSEIREASRALGLPTADTPAQPCLSSRIPHGTPVTREALAMIEAAENAVRAEGFREFRVRHIAPTHALPAARIQIACAEMPVAAEAAARLIAGVRACGYFPVEIDPDGYRPPAREGRDVVQAALDRMQTAI